MGEFKELELICLWKFYICCNNDSVHICHTIMHQSILALPIPPPRATPGHLHCFFARGPGIGTCKVVPGAGNCLPAGHLTRPDVSATNTCYYIKMASKLINIDEFDGKNEDFVDMFIHKTSHQSHMRN